MSFEFESHELLIAFPNSPGSGPSPPQTTIHTLVSCPDSDLGCASWTWELRFCIRLRMLAWDAVGAILDPKDKVVRRSGEL